MGKPDIYSICFSQLDGDKDSLLLDEGFSFLIAVRLIRDNWKAVVGNYPTSLVGEIWFDLHNMGSCFGPIFGECHQGPIASTGPVFNPILGLHLGPEHLLFQTPSGSFYYIVIQVFSCQKISLLSFLYLKFF